MVTTQGASMVRSPSQTLVSAQPRPEAPAAPSEQAARSPFETSAFEGLAHKGLEHARSLTPKAPHAGLYVEASGEIVYGSFFFDSGDFGRRAAEAALLGIQQVKDAAIDAISKAAARQFTNLTDTATKAVTRTANTALATAGSVTNSVWNVTTWPARTTASVIGSTVNALLPSPEKKPSSDEATKEEHDEATPA